MYKYAKYALTYTQSTTPRRSNDVHPLHHHCHKNNNLLTTCDISTSWLLHRSETWQSQSENFPFLIITSESFVPRHYCWNTIASVSASHIATTWPNVCSFCMAMASTCYIYDGMPRSGNACWPHSNWAIRLLCINGDGFVVTSVFALPHDCDHAMWMPSNTHLHHAYVCEWVCIEKCISTR